MPENENAASPSIEELQAENASLKRRLAEMPSVNALAPEIRRRMALGLTKDEAEQCAKSQFENDRNIEREENARRKATGKKHPPAAVVNGEITNPIGNSAE